VAADDEGVGLGLVVLTWPRPDCLRVFCRPCRKSAARCAYEAALNIARLSSFINPASMPPWPCACLSASSVAREPHKYVCSWPFKTVCIETRHAQRFLSSRPNKTDRSDARGIADMMRLGHYRPVHVKSKASQLLRTVLIARKKFVDHMLAIENTIRGLLKVHGLKLGNVHRRRFAAKVETLLADGADLRVAIEPLLEARNMMRKQKVIFDRRLGQMARRDEVCKRLMTEISRNQISG
jgi:transposase